MFSLLAPPSHSVCVDSLCRSSIPASGIPQMRGTGGSPAGYSKVRGEGGEWRGMGKEEKGGERRGGKGKKEGRCSFFIQFQ